MCSQKKCQDLLETESKLSNSNRRNFNLLNVHNVMEPLICVNERNNQFKSHSYNNH